ncbi:DUF4367 domain-containing protein [Massilistercora timonensis]|uniref:DUF4367 domain-containing protein n=1 Tax=Massilistercora timonensis TaxID=2086584 RepID=UPI00320B72D8
MKENGSDLEEIIREELHKEAEETRRTVEASETEELSRDRKEAMRQNLKEQIDEYKKEKVYEQLSPEDREALELGRQIRREREEAQEKKGRKRFGKIALNLAAVLALVSVLGITSVGGPARLVEMMKRAVGEREVVQVDSNEENLKIAEEREEEAYQKIKDAFGVDPVKIIGRPDGLRFSELEIDNTIQIAEMYYQYKGKTIVYFINASYAETSWGIDVEDEITDSYQIKREDTEIEIKEYQVSNSDKKRYSASYKYGGVEYFLMGTMEKEDFDLIIENLYFIS